ncbi:uncharacterized protein LOC103317205 [Nasonia vitripennis]|uniref:Uncharacterized protein n=1 Tax=Nasonia vitripennis TaxID=7425 RepID=A0A7M7H7T7_NASVI|nr:uncharacterized protein LOC103317205 [Nasonia vitripennis]
MEDVPKTDRKSKFDVEYEQLFARGHSRDPSGRYIVPLPLKAGGTSLLGESLTQARIALSTMHRRMKRDPKLGAEYVRFVEDYIRLGHMRRLTPSEVEDLTVAVCYICHHGIWQKGDTEDKLRVVFNASRPTSSGYSLNDVMHAGPKLQNDLAVVVTRWRTHRIVFCVDVKMMFRQIQVQQEHVHLQRILWSPNPETPARSRRRRRKRTLCGRLPQRS